MQRRTYLGSLIAAAGAALLATGAEAQVRKRRAPSSTPTRTPPSGNAPATPSRFTAAGLGPALRAAGYTPEPAGTFHRLKVEDEKYGYVMDLGLSATGDWLVCMAHLAPIPDLTRVAAAPLLGLLSTNDSLMGMSFSYDRGNGRIMLNATVPNRGLDPGTLRAVVEGVKTTVKKTEGLWDAAAW